MILTACSSTGGTPQKTALSAAPTGTSTAADATALTFGGTAKIQAGMPESELKTIGISPSTPKAHGCNRYSVPGASYLSALTAKGTVLGVRAEYIPSLGGSHPAVRTTANVHVGGTAAAVRAAYQGATITSKYLGLNSTNVLLVTDGSGKAIGFSFPGNSDASDAVPDSAVITGISAGTPDLAKGFEVCSG